jgi:hypothetical protein
MVSISLAGIAQGVMVSSYTVGTNYAGITSATNAQAGQAVDVTNVRDQIQLTATLNPNGQSVDSVVAFIANADGSNRTAAARQSFSGGSAASGNLTFVINTADFTADFTAGTAAVRFANGARQISVSAFSGTAEQRSTNSQTLAFNNVDGYAASVTAPKSAVSAAGLTWHGGPDSVTATLGSTTVVPVYYTAGRTLARATLSMRQGALGDTQACSEILEFQTGPYKFVYGGARAVFLDATVVDCSALQSDANHVVGVTAATDGAGAPAPSTTYAAGFRSSTTVPAPTALRLDYVAPAFTAVNRDRTAPAVTGWVNATYNFNTATATSADLGVGFPGTTAAEQKARRVWQWYGCGSGSATAPNTFTGLAGDLDECASNNSTTAFSIRYTESDLLGNLTTATAVQVGLDETAPEARWSTASAASDSIGTANVSATPEFRDLRSGFVDNATAATPVLAAERAVAGYRVWARGATTLASGSECRTLANSALSTATSAGSSFMSAPSCSVSTTGNELLAVADAAGWRAGQTMTTAAEGVHYFAVRATDAAGNNSATLTRRALKDEAASATDGITVTLEHPTTITTANPALAAAYTDDVKIVGGRVGVVYGNIDGTGVADTLYLPYQAQSTAFGNTLNAAGTSSPSIATPTPFASSVVASAAGTATAYTKVTDFAFKVNDATGSQITGVSVVSSASVTTQTALAATGPSVAVSTSLDAANGAGAGLKATYSTGSNAGTNVFSRIDFYRQDATATYSYLGSGTTPVQSIDAANAQQFTYVIDSYVGDPAIGAAQRPARGGDKILAIAVRTTGGAATHTALATIGGNAVVITVAGLPAGASPLITLTQASSAFSQTITASGEYALPAGTAVYSVTASSVVANNTTYVVQGITTTGTSTAISTITAGGVNLVTVTYVPNTFYLRSTISGLPTGYTAGYTHGSTAITSLANGANDVGVTSANAYTITSPTFLPAQSAAAAGGAYAGVLPEKLANPFSLTATMGGLSSTTSGTTTVAAGAPGAFTIAYVNTAQRIQINVVGPTVNTISTAGATYNILPTTLVTVACAGGTTAMSASNVGLTLASSAAGTANIYNVGRVGDVVSERTGCTVALTANHVLVGTTTYNVALTTVAAAGAVTPSVATGSTLLAANTATVTLTAVTPRIRISTTGSSVPAGLPFTVQYTSTSNGTLQTLSCTTGTLCDLAMTAGETYSLSFNRRIDVGSQRWFVANTCVGTSTYVFTPTVTVNGTQSGTGTGTTCSAASATSVDAAGNILLTGLTTASTISTAGDAIKEVSITLAGPIAVP